MCPASPALLEEVVSDTPSGQSRGLSSPTLAPLRLRSFSRPGQEIPSAPTKALPSALWQEQRLRPSLGVP